MFLIYFVSKYLNRVATIQNLNKIHFESYHTAINNKNNNMLQQLKKNQR